MDKKTDTLYHEDSLNGSERINAVIEISYPWILKSVPSAEHLSTFIEQKITEIKF